MSVGYRAVSLGRSPVLPLLAMVFITAIAIGAVVSQGLERSDAAVKLELLLGAGLAGSALVLYRPVLFPLSAYFCMIPFDNILQTGSGATLTKFLAIASAGVLLLVLVDRRRTVSPAPAVGFWVLYFAWATASLLWSAKLDMGWYTLAMLLQLFAVYLCTALLRVRPEEVRFLSVAIVLGGLASAVYGLWLYLHGQAMIQNGSEGAVRLDIHIGTTGFIQPDHFAAALVLPIALTLVAMLGRRWPVKIAAGATLVALLYGVAISAARGSVFAVGAIVAYLLIMHPRRLQLLILTGAGLVAAVPIIPNVLARFNDPTQGEAGGRFEIWKVAWNAFTHHWLYGIGVGQFRLAYTESYLQVHLNPQMFHPWAEDSHNLLASNSVELGIVGAVLIVLAWYMQFRSTKVIPRTSSLYDLRMAAEAGTLGLFVVSMSADVMWYKYIWLAFMLAVLVRNARTAEFPAAEIA